MTKLAPAPATASSDPAAAGLLPVLAARLRAAMLPGDQPLAEDALAAVAGFILTTAATRAPGEPAIAIETVAGDAAGQRRFMRIAVINDDMPFLVDSLASTVTARGIGIDRLVHPVLAVRRAADHHLTDLPEGAAAVGERRESMIYMETERVDARSRKALAAAITDTLGDVQAAVRDWPAMQAAMAADADRTSDSEGAALLRWLKDGMLTQLGHVIHQRDGTQHDALGICRRGASGILGTESFERAFAWFERPGARAPLIVKSNRLSTVHRRAPLDLFLVPVVEQGRVTALSVHAGIWTSAALAAPPMQVPRLRQHLVALTQKFGFDPGGHAGKALVHALTALPHDIVISFDDADLERTATAMMSLIDRPRPRLVLVAAPLARHLFVFVWLPRETISTATRLQIQALVEQGCAAPVLDWSMEIEGPVALLRFVLDLELDAVVPEEAPLDAQLQALVRGWAAAVEAEIARTEEPARAAALAGRYAEAFPLAYRSDHGPAEAAVDIATLRRLGDRGTGRAVRFHRHDRDGTRLRLKLYQRRGSLALTEAVPALENFGFRVIEDVPTTLAARGETLATIHDFLLDLPAAAGADLASHAPMVEDALAAVLNGEGEDDAFNRLITVTGLSAREANWLRAWYRYLRQAGLSFGVATVVEALANAPEVTLGLVDLFRARHEPGRGERETLAAAAEARIRDGLAKVAAINDDRLLRRYHALVEAILRTNAFTPHAAEALAFKLDSGLVPGLPKPLPWREIWVYGGRVEGIHLRSGPVARGGIRWSDRRDDFRTEILGLMKAQRVKNAVIVPTGAKGGFYPKRLPDPTRDRDGWLAEGKASYQLFIRTLLTITDNIVDGRVVHPQGVEVRDGEDPYFVVAADKGTATFSDTANAIADSVDFWLDDAFASGGSKGYDHKAMGITARGAWLSVQRHFLELGVDVQADPVRVVGCGDMSGDVFGNGMLLSRAIRLVAAFDHRHVFIDPNPDAAKSWDERARLFALPRSSWDDYDKALISPGGGVFPRSQKEIPLSPEARAALGIEAETIDPDSLITAILKAPVDLLWFGGIGTYVKAASENNVDVGDPANDALRVNGGEVRARVIGEGANLGCTQAGRIEFALAGGRNNTDFIDNSAGVDCSDKEVNIKIALAAAKRANRLSEPDRVTLLGEMTDAVAGLVLEDNRLQALALSIAEAGGPTVAATQLRLIDVLEANGQLDRRTEGLADRETFTRRAAEGRGLTRPELAVILSSAKLAVQDALERSALPDDPALRSELLAAFPAAMAERFAPEIEGHRLRREIIATRLANRIVNRIGMVHPFELMDEEGATAAQVVAAFYAAEQLFGLTALWQAIEDSAMPEPARLRLFSEAALATRAHMADLLRAGGGTLVPSALVADLQPGVTALAAAAEALLAGDTLTLAARREADLTAIGAPAALAAQVARLYALDGSVGLARLARDGGAEPVALTRAFIDLGFRLGLDWAQGAAARLDPADPWERLLVAGLARDFQQMRLDFLRQHATGRSENPVGEVAAWAAAQDTAIRQFRAMVARAQTALGASPAMLAQIASQARNLLGR
ncbi:NAD-glutamate dehydrogenase [Novosphingobium piscinae]|uniref:NAD-glutamate dehydrogenase n=1 Tax=Novosphingobium piscinae TaxID=1507448 RepID=A0A7X1G082_9SPHN|nr:NAD-glutamate dehydrogenase domain-containing protein [Novosphingobium piscinae]MBC2670278.1 NAD-glutamate dehydrogenase [Novosphingobium piscinae]